MPEPKDNRKNLLQDNREPAYSLLAKAKALRECLSSELESTKELVEAAQLRFSEIFRQIRMIDDGIALLEAALKAEGEAREKADVGMKKAKEIV